MKIPFASIDNDSNYKDGTCHTMINAKIDASGSIIPIQKRKSVMTVLNHYDELFQHRVNEVSNIIGIQYDTESKVSSVFLVEDNEQTELGKINDKVTGIEQTGYVVSLITPNDIYYLLYTTEAADTKNYSFLGVIPDLPKIEPIPYVENHSLRSLGEAQIGGITEDDLKTKLKAWWYKVRNDKGTRVEDVDDSLEDVVDIHFMTYGFRMYDGTVTRQSTPIPLVPECSLDTNRMVSLHNKGDSRNPEADLDKSILKMLKVVYYMKHDFTKFYERLNVGWTDLIKSVDVFISRPLGISNIERIDNSSVDFLGNLFRYENINNNRIVYREMFINEDIDIYDMFDKIDGFYYYASFDLDSKQLTPPPSSGTGAWTKTGYNNSSFPNPSNINSFDQLFSREKLDFNVSDKVKLGAMNSYSYNGRVHLSNTRQTLFNGDKPILYTLDDVEINKEVVTKKNVGDRQHPIHLEDITTYGYNGFLKPEDYPSSSPKRIDKIELVYKLKVDSGYEYVSNYTFINEYRKLFLKGIIIYPDSRAVSLDIVIYRIDGKIELVDSIELRQHPLLNISYCVFLNKVHGGINFDYWIDCRIKPIEVKVDKDGNEIVKEYSNKKLGSSKKTKISPNVIRLSELNNPFVYPNINTYQIGNGSILAMATNAMRVSEGQFGQYPLYVFTDMGIYAMNIGTDTVYSTISSPVSFDVALGPVCSTNNGVVFVSDKSIKFIGGGQQVTSLTNAISKDSIPMSFCNFDYKNLDKQINIKDYIDNIDNLYYDSFENELIVSFNCEDGLLSYANMVISLDNGSIHFNDETFNTSIKNAYPKLLVKTSVNIKDFSIKSNEDNRRVLISTRPMTLGYDGYKQIRRIKLKGTFETSKDVFENSIVLFYGAVENAKFIPFRGVKIGSAIFHDVDFGLMLGLKQRYITFVANLSLKCNTSYMLGLEFVLNKTFDNDKLR